MELYQNSFAELEAEMAQWQKRSPPTIRFPFDSRTGPGAHMGWVCCLFTSLRPRCLYGFSCFLKIPIRPRNSEERPTCYISYNFFFMLLYITRIFVQQLLLIQLVFGGIQFIGLYLFIFILTNKNHPGSIGESQHSQS